MDNLKSSHVNTKVNDMLHNWLEKTYGDKKIGQVKSTRGKVHEYLGMTLDFTNPGEVKIDMRDYVKKMVRDFPEELDHGDVVNPATSKLFQVSPQSKQLAKQKVKYFTHSLRKGFFY